MYPILRKIEYRENANLMKLNKILAKVGKVGVFGAGGYAFTLIDELRQMGIEVDYCVVDDIYLKDAQLCNGVRVVSVSQCNTTYKDSSLIIGFGIRYDQESTAICRIRSIIDDSIELIDFEDQYLSYFYYMDYAYILKNAGGFQRLYDSLWDDASKRLLIDYINGRISGNLHTVGDYQSHDGWDYDLKLLLEGTDGGSIVCCGAYDGLSALQMEKYTGSRMDVFAFESDRQNFRKLEKNTEGHRSIRPINRGVWHYTTKLGNSGAGESASLSEGAQLENDGDEIEVVALDDAVSEKVAAITMDIEGAELRALRGAKGIIQRDRPRLAIRLYHKVEDFVDLTSYVMSLSNEKNPYRLYLRYDCKYRGSADLTLYAV